MKKNRNKTILTSILASLVILFSASFVKAEDNNLYIDGTWQSPKSLAVDYARGNLDKWFKLDPASMINKNLSWKSSSDEVRPPS